MKPWKLALALAIAPAIMAVPVPAMAQNYPMVAGDYVEMSMIEIMPGGSYDYAMFIAGQWRKSQEYAKSQGWITDYRVFANVYDRDGEPNIYLVTRMKRIPDGPEIERQAEAFRKFMAQTDQQMTAASGDRAKVRKLRGTMLLQELTFK
ncbi:MAG: hypothetical protein ACKVOP_07305 [Sphingomonadaceae bacterium]